MSRSDQSENQTQPVSTHGKLQTTIKALLYGIVIVIPLAIDPALLNQAFSIKYFLFKSAAIAIAFLFIIAILLYGAKIRLTGIEPALIVFLLSLVVATILSVNTHTSIEGNYFRYDGLSSYAICAILFFAAVQYFNKSAELETLAKVSVLTAAIISLYGIAQNQVFDPVSWGYVTFETTRSFSTLGNPIVLGGYLALIFPLATVLLIQSKTKVEKTVYSLALTVISVCLFTTQSRAAWIAALIGTVLLFYMLMKKANFRIRMEFTPTIAGITIALFAILTLGAPVIINRTAATLNHSGSIESRLLMWRVALKMMMDRPFFGFGPDALGLVLPRYQVPELATLDPFATLDNVHNAFLQLALTSGIFAAGAFIFILVLLLIKAHKHLAGKDSLSMVRTALFAGIVAFLVQSLTGVTGIATYGLLWFYMGALASSWSIPKLEIKPAPAKVKYLLVSATILIGASTFFLSTQSFLGEKALAQAQLAEQARNRREADVFYRQAIALAPHDDRAYNELGIMLAENGYASKDNKLWLEGIRLLSTAVTLSPNNRSNYTMLGLGYLYGGKAFDKKYFGDALETLKKAAVLAPYAFTTRDLLGMAYLETGKLDEAHSNLSVALKINPADPQIHYHLGRYYEAVGHKKNALTAYKAALDRDKNFENAKTSYERLVKGED